MQQPFLSDCSIKHVGLWMSDRKNQMLKLSAFLLCSIIFLLSAGSSSVSSLPLSSAQVSFEDVGRLKELAQTEKVRIPHFIQDQAKYAEELTRIMAVNQLTDVELQAII